MSSAKELVSPTQPPLEPKNKFLSIPLAIETFTFFEISSTLFVFIACLLQARGVACVIAVGFTGEITGIFLSIVAGTAQVVISIPKEAVRKALPIIAGLNILQPSPPKTILPTIIAKPEPITQAQTGSAGGIEKARMMPVTTALKSPSEFGFLRMRLQSHSETTQVIMHDPVT
jgi:hypothetical protein